PGRAVRGAGRPDARAGAGLARRGARARAADRAAGDARRRGGGPARRPDRADVAAPRSRGRADRRPAPAPAAPVGPRRGGDPRARPDGPRSGVMKRWLPPTVVVVFLLAVWELIVRAGWVDPLLLP